MLSKEGPPALVRSVADQGVDPMPLWRTYAELGWTELTGTAEAVELATVPEELGRATDPTPYLATMTWFAPLVADAADGSGARHHRVRGRQRASRCHLPSRRQLPKLT
ncbi:hypothetical protein [Pseudofrankia sp. DC12]|uniref:hypothetical protein n=1 Tax=Pseudofrankia sp. DC12 TaxID=683315 RepID=UPI0005F79666|nr:hypothetical protein [Pseudofrankia sp. DC12]